MAGEEDEEAPRGVEDGADGCQQLGDVGLDLPDLALRAASERRRIEHDSAVFVPAALFARDEFHGVVADPADLSFQVGVERLVLVRPVDDAARGVEVAGVRAALCHGERSAAGVCEEVERVGVRGQERGGFAEPRPVSDLLGEETEVPEMGRLDQKIDLAPAHDPFPLVGLTQAAFPRPHAAARALAFEHGVGGVPFFFGQGGPPECVERGADDAVRADLFEFAAGARVEEEIGEDVRFVHVGQRSGFSES